MEITVTVHHEQNGFWAEVDELPGCFASGPTLSVLREALAEAVGIYLWDVPAELAGDELTVGRVPVGVLRPPGVAAGGA